MGAFLITQQPGSIPNELLSQGDNWFIFHLLSAGDLNNVQKANAHFSKDILSSLLNEPIVGQGVLWSSVSGRPYPVSFQALLFESMYQTIDPQYNKPEINNYARKFKKKFNLNIQNHFKDNNEVYEDVEENAIIIDPLEIYSQKAIEDFLSKKSDILQRIESNGYPWGGIKEELKALLPDILDNSDQVAYYLVAKMLTQKYGKQDEGWHTFKTDKGSTWVKKGPKPQE